MKINCPVGCYLRKPKLGSDQKPVIVRFNRKTGEIGMGIPGSFFLSYYKAKYDKLTGNVDIELENKYFDKLMEKERQAGVIACFFNGDLR
ncbi:MAG TPA: hypothetical protein DCP64_12890 [Sarcina sp.]|nr:hypothetical protein [Sarcina sp.]